MRTQDMQQAAEFFAGLANAPDWSAALAAQSTTEAQEAAWKAGEQDRVALLPTFRRVIAVPLPSGVPFEDPYGIQDSALLQALFMLQSRVRQTIVGLLTGQTVTFSDYTLTGRLDGGVFVESFVPQEEEESDTFNAEVRTEAKLHQLLRLQPFPFGLCPVCHKVFVQPGRGKPRRFCSDACKQKGIPSAAKRSGYALAWRHRVRDREVANARLILRAWPEERQRWLQLRRAFPRKSRRQLLYLIKQAQSKQGKED